MSFDEVLVFVTSCVYSGFSIVRWYGKLTPIRPVRRDKAVKHVLSLLPLISFLVIVFTLRFLASFDVVNDYVYILFYILLGYTWVFLGIRWIFRFFDISWIDDVLNMNNRAALITVSGAFLGLVMIYSGANIGDGPGWWCVVFAGGLGLVSWFLLRLVNSFTEVFERITVDRDVYCGSASAVTCWPADNTGKGVRRRLDLLLSYSDRVPGRLAGPAADCDGILVERYHMQGKMSETSTTYLFGSLYWAFAYIAFAVISVTFPDDRKPDIRQCTGSLLEPLWLTGSIPAAGAML